MTGFPVLFDLGLIVAGAATLLLVTRPLRLPPILAYILAGILLGPVAGLLEHSESVELFAHLGIAFLLFLVGLELSLARVRDVGRVAVTAGLLQVGITALLGAGLAALLGFGRGDALLLGLVTAFSSTVVVVKLLDRTGDVGSLHGRMAIGILLVQDVVVAVVLTLVGGLAGGEGRSVEALLTGMAGAGAGILALAAVAWTGVRFLLPHLFRWLAAAGEALFVFGLTWCFGFIVLAEAFHVSIELGAFVAGVGLAQLPWGQDLERRVHPLVNLFLSVFFVGLGATMDPAAVPDLWLPAVALSLFVLLVKPALVALLLAGSTGRSRAAFLAGLTLGQMSEFGFILVAAASAAGLVTAPALVPLVGLAGLLTIAASSVAVPQGGAVWSAVRRGRTEPEVEDEVEPPRAGHVVVVGMNTLGRHLVRRLVERGETVVAVDTDALKLDGLPAMPVMGDADSPAVLQAADAQRAKLVVSTLQIEDVNALLAFRCRALGVPVSIHAFDTSLAEELLEIGADHLMVSKVDGIPLVEGELRRLGMMG